MKNKFYLFIAIAMMSLLVSCSSEDEYPKTNQIANPALKTGTITNTAATITWNAVGNAKSYAYSINGGEEQVVTSTSITLTNLKALTSYSIRVKAVAKESLYFVDSEYTELSFKTLEFPPTVTAYRILTLADDWDKWYYEYNVDGTVNRAYRLNTDGSLDREWKFAYNGHEISTTGKNEYKMTTNDKNLVVKFIPEAGKEYTYEYNAEGYMTKVSLNGSVISNIVIVDGNIIKWSKWTQAASDTAPVEHFKLHTYSTQSNPGGIHSIYSEQFGASRWLVETGLFGKSSKNCHLSSVWDYYEGNAEKTSTYTFKVDTNANITQEMKLYGSSLENYFFTYQAYQKPI